MELKNIIGYLSEALEVERFKDYCPNGLQVEGKVDVEKMATAVSASEETIDLAVAAGVDLLLVHHGLFWRGDSPVIERNLKRKLKKLMDADMNLLAYHLPLDAHQEFGNNWGAAKEMGWKDLEPFGEFDGTPIGVKGGVGSMRVEEFRALLEKYYGQGAHFAPGGPKLIQNVALVSGGAHGKIVEAADVGADVFVSGSFDEPIWHLAKERGVNFFALGHFATERIGPRLIGNHLAEKFGLPCSYLDVENPF